MRVEALEAALDTVMAVQVCFGAVQSLGVCRAQRSVDAPYRLIAPPLLHCQSSSAALWSLQQAALEEADRQPAGCCASCCIM
jgi:hypothetical protein